MNPDRDGEFIEASNGARWLLVGLVVVLAVVYLPVIGELDRIQPRQGASLQELEQSIGAFRQLADDLLIITVVQSLLLSLYLVRIAARALAAEKFPPPGTWVLRRTRVVSGRKCKLSVAGTCLLAMLLWFPVLVPFYLRWALA